MAHGSARNAAPEELRQVAAWVPLLARIGYAAKGVVYVLIGWLAFKAAAAAGQPQGASEALATLADEPGGRLVLYAIALGLLCHVAWRAVQAILDPEHPGENSRLGMRAFYAVSGLVYGALAVTAWQIARGASNGNGNGHEVWVARLLDKPFGVWLVMLAGIAVMAYGVHQVVKAWRGDVNKRMSPDHEVVLGVRIVGRIGTAARGLVLLPIGWFVFNAGREYRATEAADTGEVLAMLDRGWMLAVIGLGLLAYGIHQLAKAWYRRITPPA